MAGRVEEGQDCAALGRHLIGADMLRDAASLARHDIRVADRIQQRGLTVVDVAHDRDDRRARFQIFGLVLDRINHLFHVGIRHAHSLVAEFVDDEFGGIGVDGLVARDHHAHLHERLHHVCAALGHTVGQFRDHDGFGKLHFADHFLGALRAAHGFLPSFFLLALHRGERALTPVPTRERVVQRELTRAAVVVTAFAACITLGRAIGALTVGFARTGGRDALGRRARSRSLGRSLIGGLFGFRGLADFFFLLSTLLGLAGLALVLFGLQAECFLAFTIFTLFRLLLGTTTLTLFLAGLFLGLAGGGLFDLTRFRGLQRLQAALHLGIGNASGTFRGIARSRFARAFRRGDARLGHDHLLAFGLDHHVLRPTVGEALLHLTGARTAETEGFFAVTIAHAVFVSFMADLPPSCLRKPASLAASLMTRGVSPPAASAPCMA